MDAEDLFSLQGKSALITGGSQGIGQMIAEAYVKAGARVYITSRNTDVCRTTAQELGRFGTCVALPADVSRLDEIEGLTDRLRQKESRLDILVNNAAATWGAALEDFPERGWDKVMDLNLKGVFFLIQKLLPLVEAAASADNPARIINIGSVDGAHVSHFETFSYVASKAGLNHLSRQLAATLASRHITVNVIAPGPFETKMMAATLAHEGKRIRERVPLRRFGSFSDIAGPALLLASRGGAYITGSVLAVDGGMAGCA
jgi:NAD(P)-dependent dehydrogenase (short-subunit alcohol dehydrogenase family)